MPKKYQKLLAVLLGEILVLSVIAVTYAYFTASVVRDATPVSVTTTVLADLTMTSMKSEVGNPVYPGWVGYQGIDVSASGSGSTIYDLNLLITGGEHILDDVLVTICKVENTTGAMSSSDFTFTPATAQVNSSATPIRFYMEGGSVTLPSPCTEVISNVTLSSLGSTYQISADGGKVLEAGKRDKYYIAYNYENKGENQVQGETFSVEPVLTARAGQDAPRAYFVDTLKSKANSLSNTNYNTSSADEKAEMYTFSHAATDQTPALADYRYIGSSPNNYVYFNCTNPSDISTCEIWRVLGVFPVDDGTGTYVDRVKLVSTSAITNYPWNSSHHSDSNFEDSSISMLLNSGDYYYRQGNYTSNGLTSGAKAMISPAKWYLATFEAGWDEDMGGTFMSTETAYDGERSSQAYTSDDYYNPTVYSLNTTEYSVGLMYLSDIAFTYAYNVSQDCYENLYSCYIPSSTTWMNFINNDSEADASLITKDAYSVLTYSITESYNGPNGTDHSSLDVFHYPVVYLNADVELDTSVTDQDGSENHPYVLKVPTNTLEFNLYVDSSGANAPKLDDNLIPVAYNATDDNWIVVNSYDSTWYNYGELKWANAITFRNMYDSYYPGDIVDVTDPYIYGMWVWIPRYEYRYTNLGENFAGGSETTPGGIDINFINGTSTTESLGYIIHPAFRNGSVNYTNNAYTTTTPYQMGGWDSEITGFWMGKFETSSAAYASGTNSKVLNDLRIKPNYRVRTYQTLADQYNSIMNLKNQHSITGLDSHMSKNSEWGAVAYLSQSIYGKYGNSNFSSVNKALYANNTVDTYTGKSSGVPMGTSNNIYLYNQGLNGTGASTTGNIYGIYDMAGGTTERQMSWLSTASATWGANSQSDDTGFSGAPSNHRYYEEYTSGTLTEACGGLPCYGQALSETAGWYGDINISPSSPHPWMARGPIGGSSTLGGIFAINPMPGESLYYVGCRVILV